MYVNNVTAERRNLSPRLIYSPNLISYKNTSKCRLWISYQEQSKIILKLYLFIFCLLIIPADTITIKI